MGKFDYWRQIPSACFAAALIPKQAWQLIGPLDERFPLYYEDSEWCYRARLLGLSVLTAPQAIVYHAYGGNSPTGEILAPEKLRSVVYGRLRFITKLLSLPWLLRFMLSYIFEDICRFGLYLLHGRLDTNKAYLFAWGDYLGALGSLLKERQSTLTQRLISDKILLSHQRQVPIPLIMDGIPQLTWDIVRNNYMPLITAGKTRPLPEFRNQTLRIKQQTVRQRALSIYKIEGLGKFLHRIGKWIQWRLAQP